MKSLIITIFLVFMFSSCKINQDCSDDCNINFQPKRITSHHKKTVSSSFAQSIALQYTTEKYYKYKNNYPSVINHHDVMSITDQAGLKTPYYSANIQLPIHADIENAKIELTAIVLKSINNNTLQPLSAHEKNELQEVSNNKNVILYNKSIILKKRNNYIIKLPIQMIYSSANSNKTFVLSNFSINISFNINQNIYTSLSRNNTNNDESLRYGIEPVGYIIITTQEILENSTQIHPFIKTKTDKGYNVYIITENDWGGGIGSTAAHNIRNWLKSNYLIKNIKYALIIGYPDPDHSKVPMKVFHPRKNAKCQKDINKTPSDFYYAEMHSHFDNDNDGYCGDMGCNNNSGDLESSHIDISYEIAVGRIPVYPKDNNVDIILAKIIELNSNKTLSLKKNVLLAMDDDYGLPQNNMLVGEKIKNKILLPLDYSYIRIYDDIFPKKYNSEYTETNAENTKLALTENQFDFFVYGTHGTQTKAHGIFDITQVKNLLLNYSPVIFQNSCSNAHPENDKNLAYTLLIHSAYAVIGATRSSWYNPIHNFNSTYSGNFTFQYTKYLLENKMTVGDALYSVKENFPPIDADSWMNTLVYNLYGDPDSSLFYH